MIKAVEQCWPASDRQHCAVHRLRNLLAKLPERERERVRGAYWQALDEATDERKAKERLEALVDQLDVAGYTAAARCLSQRPRRARSPPALPDAAPPALEKHEPARAIARRGQATDEGDRPLPGETSRLTLVWAVLDLYITNATNGIKFTQLERHTLKRMRYEGNQETIPKEVSAA